MLLKQVYILFIYILFIELAIVTVVAIALFVALTVTLRKLDNKKTHLCLVVRDAFLIKTNLRHATFLWYLTFYNYYTKLLLESQYNLNVLIHYIAILLYTNKLLYIIKFSITYSIYIFYIFNSFKLSIFISIINYF